RSPRMGATRGRGRGQAAMPSAQRRLRGHLFMISASEQAESGLRGDQAAGHGAGLWPRISTVAFGPAAAAVARRMRAFGGHLELPAPAALGAVLTVGTLTKGNTPSWAFAAVGVGYLGYVVGRCVLARGDEAPPQASEPAVAEPLPRTGGTPLFNRWNGSRS